MFSPLITKGRQVKYFIYKKKIFKIHNSIKCKLIKLIFLSLCLFDKFLFRAGRAAFMLK